MRVLVTGGSGFVGHALAHRLALAAGVAVCCSIRGAGRSRLPSGADVIEADLSLTTDWSDALAGVDVVVHTAARVHIMSERDDNALAAFREVNVAGTLNLARQAAVAGVRRFVFLSSIKVNGEQTQLGRPFTSDDVVAPEDAYGISKAEAEAGLRQVASETDMEVVIIRPPLVYGAGVKGNFSTLVHLVDRGFPLPLGAVRSNRRSLVGLDNLLDLIHTCLDHPRAANQIFLVSDCEDLSTADLLMRIGKALNRPARLLAVPVGILNFAAGLLGMRFIAQRLLGSLLVDVGKTCALLDWTPPFSVDEGLRRAFQKRL
jgi:nucleoside-diphosphate-sugar epimerase